MKVLINKSYGGFGLSSAVWDYLSIEVQYPWNMEISRSDLSLIAAVETIGLKESADEFAELKIVEIPNGVDYIIQKYDGIEWIAEKHRVWS